MSGESIVLSVGRVKVPEFTKEVLQESEEGVPTSFDNRVGDTGDARGLSRREIGNDAGKELQIERGGNGGERVRDTEGGWLTS